MSKQLTVYKISELPGLVQLQVLNKNRYMLVSSPDWDDIIIECLTALLNEKGFTNVDITYDINGYPSYARFVADVNVELIGTEFEGCSVSLVASKNPRDVEIHFIGPIELENRFKSKYMELCNVVLDDISNEYEYLTSDEYLMEFFDSNEFYFTENGVQV